MILHPLDAALRGSDRRAAAGGGAAHLCERTRAAAATSCGLRPPPCLLPCPLAKAQAALASVHKEAASFGVQLLPLRSPADILKLAEVELLYPAGLTNRWRKMLAELRDWHVATEFELMQLVPGGAAQAAGRVGGGAVAAKDRPIVPAVGAAVHASRAPASRAALLEVAEHNALGDAGCGGWLRLLAIRDVDGHGLDLVGRQRLLAPV